MGNFIAVNTPEAEEEIAAPKNAAGLAAMVKAFGEDKLIAASTSLAAKLPRIAEIPDASVEQLAAVECSQCSERLPSILVSWKSKCGNLSQESEDLVLRQGNLDKFCA